MTIVLIMFGYFMTLVSAEGVADVVLSCTLVEEGVGLNGIGGGSMFTRTPATLVLRDVAMASDQDPETLTPFIPPSVPDPDFILFETKVSSPEIPNGDLLLHADCNEQEVLCEISRYSSSGQETSQPIYFMVSISVEGDAFGTVLIMQTLPVVKAHSGEETLIQSKLGLPLSQSGSLLTEVVFLVFSDARSVSAPLRSEVLLSCGFRQQEMPSEQEVGIEWRLQHRGKGQKVLEMTTRLDDAEGSAVVHTEREGSSMDVPLVASDNNASVILSKLKVSDEGTYICTVSIGPFHAQQVIQLYVIQPPRVSLSEEKLVLTADSPQTLSCHCSKYYPLDAKMEWLSLSSTETEAKVLPYQGSLTSHRQHGDGTYSLSSHLTIPSSVTSGTTFTCRVSHAALDSPLSVSALVEDPEPDSYWLFVGFLVITVLFIYQVMR